MVMAGIVASIAGSSTAFTADTEPSVRRDRHGFIEGEKLPTGARITPTAAPGSHFQWLNPDLPTRPEYRADHAVSTVLSPDKRTLLVLTSGYNRNNGPTGQRVAAESNEYVFVYDVTGTSPIKQHVLQVPNTFAGIAWNPNGEEFYVAGGVNDNVHVYRRDGGQWQEAGAPIALGHTAGLGRGVQPMAAGLAVNRSGTRLIVSNYENDSVSLIDLSTRTVLNELDLRPGKSDPSQRGEPGGEYPFWVVFHGDSKAYVSSQRDREVVILSTLNDVLSVSGRLVVSGQPNKMILNADQSRLFVAVDNSDTTAIIDTARDRVLEEFSITAPTEIFRNGKVLKGSNPNALALSPDEQTLFVTNGGTNTVAVVQLPGEKKDSRKQREENEEEEQGERDERHRNSRVIGLIPTGWYPSDVAVSADGKKLYVVNGKSPSGPNPGACRDTLSIAPGSNNACTSTNQYIWQLEKAGLLTVPMPSPSTLAHTTWQAAYNNNFPVVKRHDRNAGMMEFVRSRIDHVIYVVKENRTYDQVLGALDRGNGDPSLAILAPYSPNHEALAKQFVTLDNFHDSGETSNTGWNWTTAARSTDFTEKTSPVNYAGRGLTYDWEGVNRNINVGLDTLEKRQAAQPLTPSDPDLLPGTADVAAPDAPGKKGEAGAGYLWDSALRAGLTVRNYGFYGDGSRYSPSDPNYIPLAREPHKEAIVQFYAAKESLLDVSAPYFRGYDMKYPDYWRYKDWEREFSQYEASGRLPNLSLVRLPHDHFGDYASAIDGVNTVETQMADNDYSLGLIIERVARSRFRDNTLIFVIEDDAQNGPDHVDAHRSIAYIVGPYVKRGAVVSEHYTTVSMLRTIEDVLGIEPLGLNDGLAEPMAEVFNPRQRKWSYQAIVPDVLYTTALPLPPRKAGSSLAVVPVRDAAYWAKAMAGQNFTGEDLLDEPRFNRALWEGLQGEDAPFPEHRHGRDMSKDRQRLLQRYEHTSEIASR